jgi:hypothetical protein
VLNLFDAIGAVEWGESQLPVLANRFHIWQAINVQLIRKDPNPPIGNLAAEAIQKEDLPSIFNAEIGAIIGSFRSSLDLLAAAIATGNGITPSRDTHFPIFGSHQDMIDPFYGIEGKKWLSPAEMLIIKSRHPYEGGNDALWVLHQLDILRKHERLIRCTVYPHLDYVVGDGIIFPDGMRSIPLRNLKDKPVLFEYPRDAPQPKAQLSTEIVFDEINVSGIRSHPVFPTLVYLKDFVREIIGRFD